MFSGAQCSFGCSDCQECYSLSSIFSLIHLSPVPIVPTLSSSVYFSGNDSIPLALLAKDNKVTPNLPSALGFGGR